MKRKSRKKLLFIPFIIFLLFLGFMAAGMFSFYSKVEQTVASMHEPIEREKSEKRYEPVDIVEEKDPISILLLGVDERHGDRGRSDSMIVLTVNPTDNSMKMLSIPRDTRTEIIGKGIQDKINHAYAFGGPTMTIETVENLLNIPIDYFIQVNMKSFVELVDTLDGISVQNEFAFSYWKFDFPAGELELNGEEALAFSQMRYDDPKGDFGRQDRQKKVIYSIIDKGASLSSLTKLGDILQVLGDNVKTNLTFDEMVDIQTHYKAARHQVEQLSFQGTGTYINGIFYYIVDDYSLQQISDQLNTHLDLK
ncbi:LCP family protein [Bacillus timonensis]|nr:LCP family protein [Bacillus timonensis]